MHKSPKPFVSSNAKATPALTTAQNLEKKKQIEKYLCIVKSLKDKFIFAIRAPGQISTLDLINSKQFSINKQT